MGQKTSNPDFCVGGCGCVQRENLAVCFWERTPRPGALKESWKASQMQS